jgi:putative ABC transport system permease protein
MIAGTIARLALKSLANRRLTAILTVVSIAVSVMLLLGVEKIRTGARESFASTISGTDLIIGARGGGVQLLLYAVFGIGNATNNVTWQSYQDIASRPEVAWIVPLSLGDSHRGYRVVGTTPEFFTRYQYGRRQGLRFAAGKPFAGLFDAVIGAEAARALGYHVGSEIVIAHGTGAVSFQDHADKPFTVVGILAPTGTPVDRRVMVSLDAIEAIHVDWRSGAPPAPGTEIGPGEVRRMEEAGQLKPQAVTAALIGLKSRINTFSLQRAVNEYRAEPLTAILPGVALAELWSVVGAAEQALLAVSAMVVATALLGMATAIFSTLNERRREMAILRSVGARPAHVLGLLVAEAGALALAGAALGTAATYAVLLVGAPLVERATGLYADLAPVGPREAWMLAAVILAGFVVGLVPALRAYRLSLGDGLTVRL